MSSFPYFLDSSSQMAMRLSALHTGSPLAQGRFLVLTSISDLFDPRFIARLEVIVLLKNPTASSVREQATLQLVE
jgi:hypothetical protein